MGTQGRTATSYGNIPPAEPPLCYDIDSSREGTSKKTNAEKQEFSSLSNYTVTQPLLRECSSGDLGRYYNITPKRIAYIPGMHQRSILIMGMNPVKRAEDILCIVRENLVRIFPNIPHIAEDRPLCDNIQPSQADNMRKALGVVNQKRVAKTAEGRFKNIVICKHNNQNRQHVISENKSIEGEAISNVSVRDEEGKQKHTQEVLSMLHKRQQLHAIGAELLCVPEFYTPKNNEYGTRMIMPFCGEDCLYYMSENSTLLSRKQMMSDIYFASKALEDAGFAATDLKLENTIAIQTNRGMRFALVDIDDIEKIDSSLDAVSTENAWILEEYNKDASTLAYPIKEGNQLRRLYSLFETVCYLGSNPLKSTASVISHAKRMFGTTITGTEATVFRNFMNNPSSMFCLAGNEAEKLQQLRENIEYIDRLFRKFCGITTHIPAQGIRKNYTDIECTTPVFHSRNNDESIVIVHTI